MPQPWEVGDERQRWAGYLDERYPDLDAGQHVLRNNVGATSYEQLRRMEDRYVEVRAQQADHLGIPATFDYDGLKQLHGHLFQDVYPWAGQERTVNIGKEDVAFMPREAIGEGMQAVNDLLRDTDGLKSVPAEQKSEAFAVVYSAINRCHPFREGNGRTNRAFMQALAHHNDVHLDWRSVQGTLNDLASQLDRMGNPEPMRQMFQGIMHPSANEAPPADPPHQPANPARAAFPQSATDATRTSPQAGPPRPPQMPRVEGRTSGPEAGD